MFFLIGPYFGEYAILYLFVRTKYGWEVTEYSRYSGIIFGLNIFGWCRHKESLKRNRFKIFIFQI